MSDNPLWGKYQLSTLAGVWVEQPKGHWQLRHYSSLPHDLVCRYLEEHLIDQQGYRQHEPGYWYLDILPRAEALYNSGRPSASFTVEREQDEDPRPDRASFNQKGSYYDYWPRWKDERDGLL